MAKKVVLVAALALGLGLARPLPVAAHTSFSLGVWVPGFSFFVADPPPPPVYYYPPAPVYYAPAPVVIHRHGPPWGHVKYRKHHGYRGHKHWRH